MVHPGGFEPPTARFVAEYSIQLSGFVSSAESAKRAVEVTRRVQGVRMVENDLRIK